MAPTTTNAEIGRKLDLLAENFAAHSSNINARLTAIESQTSKLSEAMFGNGGPGVKEQIRRHTEIIETMNVKGGEKVQAIEDDLDRMLTQHAGCNIGEVVEQVKEISKRHDEEDKTRAEHKEESKETRRENRKWFLALGLSVATSIAITAIDFVYHILGVK